MFRYYYTGQIGSDDWASKRKLVYPKEYDNFLMIQKWTVDLEPTRQKAIERLHRLANFCAKEGIPNPYTLFEINYADRRWKKLHENAVPAFVDIQKLEVMIKKKNKVTE